ncbi:N-formylglutamate amidohydrolase [Paraburkholderia ginsengiterrae]|uniref:N-formylglutamate amidohydrolase n=1 Tax=Paraburkholderia ginsengiterrae TaxID=1462993 RepID=A0A1A9NCT3_9BURK|nr:N-formylglutamate amidohydrolase [Paraburkholderia ginsengiterrae]OAJ60403.1 N-formylglutamate amidohydrolase [Paraburkholderia ginsengiterrae]OAJ63955.1 N-formylglutamate amidohydrolase [Paraburkholderia ginsengiterrae]
MTPDSNTFATPPDAPFFVAEPNGVPLPILFDSPHSGIVLPADFGTCAPVAAIRSSWDAFVDTLWAGVPAQGGVLIGACFPRAYIDPNRAITDIDVQLLAEPWPEPLAPEKYTLRGMGLIRRDALPNVPMYDRKLSVAEVRHRIDAYYRPYRAALSAAAERTYARHGALWHVDCHSMKSRGNEMNVDAGEARPDFVISDRLGTTADPAFTQWVADYFSGAGYSVQVNEPYQGGDLLAAVSDPARRRHSIQIELNRALYMDEATFVKHAGFDALKRDLDAFAAALADYVRAQLAAPHAAQ